MRTWILAGKKVLGEWLCYRSCKSILDFGFDQLNLEEIYASYKIGNEGSKSFDEVWVSILS